MANEDKDRNVENGVSEENALNEETFKEEENGGHEEITDNLETEPAEEAFLSDSSMEENKKALNNKNIIYAVVAVLLVAALAITAFTGAFGTLAGIIPGAEDETGEDVSDLNGEDVGDIGGDAGDVVATVNGEEIPGSEYEMRLQQQMQMYQAQGMDLESEEMGQMLEQIQMQVLDGLIVTLLLQQKAEEEGITASQEEIDELYEETAEQFGGEEQLKQQLQMAGVSMEELNEDIVRQLTINNYLDSYIEEQVESGNLDHSEEELKELYNEYGDQMQEDFEDVKDDLEMMLREEFIGEHIEDLREDSEINIHM